MSDFQAGRDLLGDPIPENFGKRGRPAHIPTDRNRNKVRLLLAFGWTDPAISAALRITKPTLTKYYFRELRHRDEAKPALEAEHLAMVFEAAKGGNVGAMKELGRMLDRLNLTAAGAAFGARQRDSDSDSDSDSGGTAVTPGKKQQALIDAGSAGEGTPWGRDLLPPEDTRH